MHAAHAKEKYKITICIYVRTYVCMYSPVRTSSAQRQTRIGKEEAIEQPTSPVRLDRQTDTFMHMGITQVGILAALPTLYLFNVIADF